MQMSDSNDDNLTHRWLIDEAIWEAPQLTSSDAASQWRPSIRKLSNTLDGKPSLIAEFTPQASALFVVVANRLDQLTLRRI